MSRHPCWLAVTMLLWLGPHGDAQDLAAIKQSGRLRHVGIPYANFVTGAGDGFDVELMQAFAKRLGVGYEFVRADWTDAFGLLTGQMVRAKGENSEVLGKTPIQGDVLACGVTILPWRKQVVDFSTPVFPTQVWLVSGADSEVRPIVPGKSLEADIHLVKSLIAGRTLLCKANTCLDPTLYDISATGAKYLMFSGSLNELAPAVILGEAEMTLLDVPDTLVALQKWPGQIKVIGPVGEVQQMAVAFRKQSPGLRQEFNRFLRDCHADGTYLRLVRQYYPMVESFYPDFFRSLGSSPPSIGSSGASSPVGATAAVGPAPAPRSSAE